MPCTHILVTSVSALRNPGLKIRKTDYMLCFNFVWVSGGFVGIHAVSNMCNCSEVHLLFMQSRYSELFDYVTILLTRWQRRYFMCTHSWYSLISITWSRIWNMGYDEIRVTHMKYRRHVSLNKCAQMSKKCQRQTM